MDFQRRALISHLWWEQSFHRDTPTFSERLQRCLGLEGTALGDNTVPWSIYSCPELLIPPIPVTAVNVSLNPSYPMNDTRYEEQG